MPPIPHPPVSGRYRGRGGGFEVELRVDVDGSRPMNRVSADYFELRGREKVYAGSMRVDALAVASSRSLLTITGVCLSSWGTDARNVKVTIPRVVPSGQPGRATLSHFTASGRVRASYDCAYESAAFRRVLLEEDAEQGVQRFESYDTALLEAGSSPGVLSHLSAFAAAGIELVPAREPGSVDSSDVGPDVSWSDSELQAAMVRHFSVLADVPQWAVWLLHARLHDRDRGSAHPKLLGLMFDQRGRQRQGCALFYEGMAGTSPERQRTQLFTCVHELGHGFNLLHSFQKSLASPPVPSRPGSATWMAYPDLFPGGEERFWSTFAFHFDDPELVHLRHAVRDDVIMGGNPLTAGAAFEQDAGTPALRQADPGLRLTLTAPPALPYGVPVSVDLELSGTTREGRRAPRVLGPRPGNVDVLIRRPDGTARTFEPLLHHCRADDALLLRAGDRPVRDSAFIHFGKDGFAFDRPGRYEIAARCAAPDGVVVLSNAVRIDVRRPVTRADHAVATLAFGEEQGTLMSLVGSDAPELRGGNEALRALVERYPRHPVAAVPRLIHATHAAREFKSIHLDGRVNVRPSRPHEAAALLQGMPGLEAVLRAAVVGSDETTLPRVVGDLLRRVPTDPTSARVLHPYIRSRINEIATVVPQALASASAGPVAQGRASGRGRTRPL